MEVAATRLLVVGWPLFASARLSWSTIYAACGCSILLYLCLHLLDFFDGIFVIDRVDVAVYLYVFVVAIKNEDFSAYELGVSCLWRLGCHLELLTENQEEN